jgi:hypothetical protein
MATHLVFKDLRGKPAKMDLAVPQFLRPALPSSFCLRLSAPAATRLEYLAVTYAEGSRSGLIRKAIHVYDWCRTVEAGGSRLLLESPDGTTRQRVKLP